MPRVALHTLGCKLNFAETSAIGKQFLEQGYEVVEFGHPADVNVINTCSVTARANQECRQMIRRALRVSPDAFVVVTGCYAQLEPEEVGAIEGVDLVLGAKEKFDLLRLAGDMHKLSCARIEVSDIDDVAAFGPAYSTEAGGRTRAFLKVQDGCSYSCSFCTIPQARGKSRSQSLEESLRQARSLVAHGFKEIVLTGVNVGDYGQRHGLALIDLLRGLIEIEGLERLRVSSIEPNLLTNEIVELAVANSKLCKHFHIPLQSGSDAILRKMRRRYTTSQYASRIARLKDRLPEAGIGVDVIVGFPGESDEDFEETHRFLADLPVAYLHVFTYSERPNTPAAGYEGKVPPAVRSRRNAVLRTLSQKKRQDFLDGQRGKSLKILLESEVDEGLRFGLSETYARVGVPAAGTRENSLVNVTISDVRAGYCIGVPEEAV